MNRIIVNVGNTEMLEENGLYPSKIGMIKYENIFDFFSTEPVSISIQKKKEKKQIKYSEIFRIRKWEMDKCVSWNIYSKDREKLDGIVLRKVVWNKKSDKDDFKRAASERNENEKLNCFPSIESENVYVSNKQSAYIYKIMNEIDKILENGIKFNKDIVDLSHSDTEILRLYDWGQIHLTWGEWRTPKLLEKRIHSFFEIFDEIQKNNTKKIFLMKFNYSIPLELYEKIYIRGEYDL